MNCPAVALILDLRERGIAVIPDPDGALRVRGPYTPDDLDALRAHKADVRQHLENELLSSAMEAFADSVPACGACGQRSWRWKSIGEVYVCNVCHPVPEVSRET